MSVEDRVGKWDYDKRTFIASQAPDLEVRKGAMIYAEVPLADGGFITLDECIKRAELDIRIIRILNEIPKK